VAEEQGCREVNGVGALLQILIKQHGGKTMFGSALTFLLVAWTGMEAGWIPTPATRAYVDQAITTGTKGLDYIVKQAIEADVDVVAYEVTCMRETWKQSQLNRLRDQYRDLVGENYPEKNCDELERRVQRMVGQVR
jgi:hypothetical protein